MFHRVWSEVSEIFTTSVRCAAHAAKPNRKTNFVAALSTARRHSEPYGSLCHRYPACASFPPAGPALRARASVREPRDPGLPFRLAPDKLQNLCSRK
jgi:hypothetical protein